jgi:hypothetical protein
LNSELSQEIPSFDPVDQGEGEEWDTVGEPAERSRSPAPTVEELLAQLAQQKTRVVEQQVPIEESRSGPSTTDGTKEPVRHKLQKRRPPKPGL